MLWAAQDREQHSWEQSTYCHGDLAVKLSSKEGQSTTGLHLHPTFSFIYSLRINPSETKFSDNQAKWTNSSWPGCKIFTLRTTKLQTICQGFVTSAQLDGLDLWGKFSPLLCLSQLEEANVTNGLAKKAVLFPLPTFTSELGTRYSMGYNKQD